MGKGVGSALQQGQEYAYIVTHVYRPIRKWCTVIAQDKSAALSADTIKGEQLRDLQLIRNINNDVKRKGSFVSCRIK